MHRRLVTWVVTALVVVGLATVQATPASAAMSTQHGVGARLQGAPASVLYITQYDGAIHELDGSGGARHIDGARWRDVYQYQAPVPAPTDYVKYPWSNTVYAVTFWSNDAAKWLWQAVSLQQWQRAGAPAPRAAGWIAGSSYHRWVTSNELFVRGPDGVTHKLDYAEWQASGFRSYETLDDQGFQKLTWSSNVARMSGVAAGQGGAVTYATWASEDFPSPAQVRRFPGDKFTKDACSDTVVYAGPTMNRAISYQEYVAAGAPRVEVVNAGPCSPPTVTALSPSTGPSAGGTEVVISGTELENVTAVSFGAVPARSFTVESATRLRATSPGGAAGTVAVTVTTSAGTSPSRTFTYTSIVPSAPPVRTVSGAISVNTTWGPDRAKVYRVTEDLVVNAGATLTILPGTVVKVRSGRTIVVEGAVDAQGTVAAPVVVTSETDDGVAGDTNGDGAATAPAAGDHLGLSVRPGGSLVMANSRVAFAATAITATGTKGAMATLDLSATAISKSTRCVQASGPIDASFTGSVRDCQVGVTSEYAFDARGVDWGSSAGPFPYGTGVGVEGLSVRVVPWTGYSAPSRPAVAAAQAAPSVAPCAEVVLVGARGSGEWPASPGPTTLPEFDSDSSGFGPYNYVAAAKLVEEMAVSRPSTTVKYLGVQYLALSTPVHDARVSYGVYLASVYDGVDKLRQLVASESARCPASVFVLFGNSQGALVVDLMLDQVTQVEQQQRIAGVVLLANPGRTVGSPEIVWEASGQVAGAGVANAGGLWTDLYPGFDAALPKWVAPRTISLCSEWDVVCSFRPGASLEEHASYSIAEIQSLGLWQASRVVAALPPA